MAIEHGVDRAPGGDAYVTCEPLDEQFADFAGTPMGALTLGADDQALELGRELVGIAPGPARATPSAMSP